MKRALKITGIAVAVLTLAIVSFGYYNDIKPIALGIHTPIYQRSGTAMAGYDVVSYFQGGPKMGDVNFSTEWKNTIWIFSSNENLQAFKASPEKYEPQFGGYCTKAVSSEQFIQEYFR